MICFALWRCSHRPRTRRSGFTLIELLVVIGIIALLAGMIFPAVQMVRESGRRAVCLNNLHEIGTAMGSYHSAKETFPAGMMDPRSSSKPQGKQLSWNVYLLPYLGQEVVSRQFDMSKGFDSAENHLAGSTVIPFFLCPSTSRYFNNRQGNSAGDINGNGTWDPRDDLAFTDYGGVYGYSGFNLPDSNGVLLKGRGVGMREITDGKSQTLMVAENTGRGTAWDGEWVNGENIFGQSGMINDRNRPQPEWGNNEMWGDHSGGVLALFCDGSVHYLTDDISRESIAALCTRNTNDKSDWVAK